MTARRSCIICRVGIITRSWGRFINIDTTLENIGELLGHNLFIYCKNNPVNMSDPSGFGPMFEEEALQRAYTEYKLNQKIARQHKANNVSINNKNAPVSSNLGLVSTVQTGFRTGISAIGSLARLAPAESRALGVYGYVFSTPFAIASHLTDPRLTTIEKIGLSVLEIGLAAIGILIAGASFTPVGWLGVGITVAISFLSYEVSDWVTSSYEKRKVNY